MENITYVTFEHTMESLRGAIKDYYGRHSNDKIFDIFLANGDRLTYTIPESKIAHLLGIDTNYLLSTSLFTTDSKLSIEVLEKFCSEEEVYSNYKHFSNGLLDYNKVFSDYFQQKLLAFENNVQPNAYQIEFVCKVDRDICHYNGTDPINVDYLICSKDENDNYIVLGISKDGKNGITYMPTSNQLFSSLEELKSKIGYLITNQDITFISKLFIKSRTSDYNVNVVLSPGLKATKVSNLAEYKKELQAHINIDYDYSLMAKQSAQNYENISSIVSLMESKTTITADMLYGLPYLGNNLKGLINAYNNVLHSGGSNDTSTPYSQLESSYETLKQELYLLKEQVATLTEKNTMLESEKQELIEERDTYRSTLDTVQNAVQKTFVKYQSK